MTRSRDRERERIHRPVETSDPAGLAVYANGLRPVVAALRVFAEDATVMPDDRQVHSRHHLRRGMLKALRELEARIDVATREPSPAD